MRWWTMTTVIMVPSKIVHLESDSEKYHLQSFIWTRDLAGHETDQDIKHVYTILLFFIHIEKAWQRSSTQISSTWLQEGQSDEKSEDLARELLGYDRSLAVIMDYNMIKTLWISIRNLPLEMCASWSKIAAEISSQSPVTVSHRAGE